MLNTINSKLIVGLYVCVFIFLTCQSVVGAPDENELLEDARKRKRPFYHLFEAPQPGESAMWGNILVYENKRIASGQTMVPRANGTVSPQEGHASSYIFKPFHGLYGGYSWLAGLVAVKIKVAVIAFTVFSIAAIFFKMFIGYFSVSLAKLWPTCPSCPVIAHEHYDKHETISYTPPPNYHYDSYEHDFDTSGSMVQYNRVKYAPTTPRYSNPGARRLSRSVNGVDHLTANRIIRSIEEFEPDMTRIESICKRKYVCEADVRARHNFAAAYELYFFGREGLAKYRDRKRAPPQSYQQCAKLYKACTESQSRSFGKRKRRNVT